LLSELAIFPSSDFSLGCGGAAGLASDRGSVNVFKIGAFVRRDAQWQGQTHFGSTGEYSLLAVPFSRRFRPMRSAILTLFSEGDTVRLQEN